MNDVTPPPSLGAQLEILWKAFQSAAGAFAARIEELRAAEQAVERERVIRWLDLHGR